MAKNKTTERVNDFLNLVADETKRTDSYQLMEIIQNQTQLDAHMWRPSIIGFGTYHYKYASGHEGDAPLVGFSPRKDAISLYTTLDPTKRDDLLQRLGKHKAGKGCIYIKKLSDLNLEVLKEMIDESVRFSRLQDTSLQ